MDIHEFEWRNYSFLGAFLAFSDYKDWDSRDKFYIDQVQ